MKKIGILLVLILISSISFISAIDISLQKSSYNSMETLEAEITGGFIEPLAPENIGIYAEDGIHKSPTKDTNLVQYNNKYYYYAIVPESPGKYILRIENTKHYVGTKESTDKVERSFTVVESNASYLSYNPGFIYTAKDFSITITAYNKNQDITVDFPEAKFKQTFNLGYNQVKTVYIPIANITNTTISQIKIGSYSLPAIIITNPNINTNKTNQLNLNLEDVLKINPSEITSTMLEDTQDSYEIYIRAEDDAEPIEDLKISSLNKNINVSPTYFSEVSSTRVIEVTISGKEEFNSYINLSIENSSLLIPINIQLTRIPSNVTYNNTVPVTQKQTCTEMKGAYCLEGQTCSSLQRIDSIRNLCCISQCTASSSFSSKWFWIILIIIVLGAGGWYLYKKSQAGELNVNKFSSNVISKRSDDYKKRIESEPKETHSGLTKD